MKDIVIIGAGGFGREVEWLIEEINKENSTWNLLGYIDDSYKTDVGIGKSKVIGNVEWLKSKSLYVVCAIGDPITKKNVINQLIHTKNEYPVLIHPTVRYSDQVHFGEGSIICSGTILTVNVHINDHVIINLDSTVGHDVRIGSFSTISPGANISGNVQIENNVYIGTGAKIIQDINIGSNSIIGAGAIVTKHIPRNVIAVGMPAKSIKERFKG